MSSSLFAVTALLAVVAVVVAIIVVVVAVLVVRARRTQVRYDGPVAAPGVREARSEAANLALALDDQVDRARTALEFARLQLGEAATGELTGAVDEGRAAAAELSHALSAAEGTTTQGPTGTVAAGQLAAALSRARAARSALSAAETRVADATRRLDPPTG